MTKIDYSTYKLNKKEKLGFLAVGYVCAFAGTYIFYGSLLFSGIVGFLLPGLVIGKYIEYLGGKRKIFLTMQFKDLLYSLSASVTTGHQMAEALSEALENLRLIYDDNTPLVLELKQMVKRISENRESDPDLLFDFARRSDCEDIHNFVQVYLTCRTMGGDLEKVMINTTEILADKITIEREIKTLTAQKKFEGKIISAMPIVVILFLNLVSPDYLMPLYTTGLGRIIMTMALAGIGMAYMITEKLTDIEV
ncbi:MAG: type II secretion system F family protein [Anaerovoracaceae bacterium]